MKTELRTPLSRVRGLGSAKEGVGHWWWQRLTAIALLPLCVWFVWLAISLAGADYATARATVGQPFTASLLILFIIALFYHGALGLQVVIEDYIHQRAAELFLQVAVKLSAFLLTVVGVVAVLRITLGN